MEGKDHFRTAWTQQPLFSGGNVTSLALPLADTPTTMAAATVAPARKGGPHAAHESGTAYVEALVMACADTVNIVHAEDGQLLCSYTLPVEDLILYVDAVSLLARAERAARAAAQHAGNARKRPRQTETGEEAVAKPQTDDAPPGSYVAVGTRSLQIYLLRIDLATEMTAKTRGSDVGATDTTASATSAQIGNGHKETRYTCHLVQSWTAAQHAISLVGFSTTGRYLVSCATDGGVKAWDAFHHHLTHNLRCPDGGLVSALYLNPNETLLLLGSVEGYVSVFDFVAKRLVATLRPHVQAVEAVVLGEDDTTVISLAQDRKLAFSQLVQGGDVQHKGGSGGSLREQRAVVLKEHVARAVFVSTCAGLRLHVGAVDGTVASYHVSLTEPIRLLRRLPRPPARDGDASDDEAAVRALVVAHRPKGLPSPSSAAAQVDDETVLYVADAAFNIHRVVAQPPATEPQGTALYRTTQSIVGFLDQILDIKLLAPNDVRRRVVVSNSKDVRLFDSVGCLSRHVLQGHTDIVLCCAIDSSGTLIATAGKDRTVRFWSTASCMTVAVGVNGHSADITALAFNAKQSSTYCVLFSISTDENLRLWDVGQQVLPRLSPAASTETGAVNEFAHRGGVNAAHSGPIYAVAVAPNDQYVATGGKDKVIHLWNMTGKKLYKDATLQGHRRGIAALVFSPVDRVLASASSDGAVRLWSLSSLTCVKTLQTDRTPVLQLAFLNKGTQIVTGNAEGVLRVWAIATAESVWAAELHDEKVWALQVVEDTKGGTEDETTRFVSGSADGVLIVTEDYTAEAVQQMREEREDMVLKEQALTNALRGGGFVDAFRLALQLSHPRHLRQVLTRWSAKARTECEQHLRNTLLPQLTQDELLRLLQFTREWITNSRYCDIASLVTCALLASYHFVEVARLPAMHALVEPLLLYSQKHSQRQHNLLRRTYYVDYITRGLTPTMLTSMPPFVKCAAPSNDSPTGTG